jgi:6-phosphofructokinase 1
MKRIAVITSGGDAPGMNAAIRAVTLKGLNAGCQVFGVKKGYQGLITGEIVELNSYAVSQILHRGGTILFSTRCPEFKEEQGMKKAKEHLERLGIEGLIVIGGDGSFRGAMDLSKMGFAVIGIPATIDNDIGGTELSLGFDTAVNTALDAINKIRDTAISHERVYVVEVMGRNAGFIALYAGLAGAADAILIPEVEPDLDEVVFRVKNATAKGRGHSIVVVAEGLFGNPMSGRTTAESSAFKVGNYVMEKTGKDTRITILGHLQRGGSPSATDRILGTRFGAKAMEQLLSGATEQMLGWNKNEVTIGPLRDGITKRNHLDLTLLSLADLLAVT